MPIAVAVKALPFCEVVGKTAFFVGKEGLVDSKVLPMHQVPGPACA